MPRPHPRLRRPPRAPRLLASLAAAAAVLLGPPAAPARAPVPAPRAVPAVDAHVHLLSADASAWLARAGRGEGDMGAEPRDAAQLVAMLDSAGIARAVVASGAYQLAPGPVSADPAEEARVRAENDWTLAQVARHPGRLLALCSVNPLRDHAVRELVRCADAGGAGLKLHLPASGAQVRRAEHRAALRRLLAVADRRGLTVLVHLRGAEEFGAEDAALFVREVLASAPGARVQVAHLGGWGGYDAATDDALAAFARMAAAGEPGTERLTLDVAAVFLGGDGSADDARLRARLGERLRALGPGRVVFGSDWPFYSSGAYLADVALELRADPDLLARIVAGAPEGVALRLPATRPNQCVPAAPVAPCAITDAHTTRLTTCQTRGACSRCSIHEAQ